MLRAPSPPPPRAVPANRIAGVSLQCQCQFDITLGRVITFRPKGSQGGTMSFIPGILIFLIALALPLSAQNFAEITGAVSDATGAVMSGAAVTAISATTNQVRRATTNETGNYSLPYLVPGTYD